MKVSNSNNLTKEISLSQVTRGLSGQPMFALLKRVKELEENGKSIIRFEIGDSAFNPKKQIIDSTKTALNNFHTSYVNSQGMIEFRKEIQNHVKKQLGFIPDLNQILVMPSNAIIDFTIRCTVNENEEVIYPDPGFPTYKAVLNYTGLKGVSLSQGNGRGFDIKINELERKISKKTKLVINNSPNNPTGMVMSESKIKKMFSLIEKNNLFLLSDEVYSDLSYEKKHFSPGQIDHCKKHTIILNGFSKNFGMAGWRLGYAIGPEDLISKMTLLFETTYSCVPPFIQETGKDVLRNHENWFKDYKETIKGLRDTMVMSLNEIPGVSCDFPEGGYYAFANIKNTGMTAEEFSSVMLEQAGVAVLPGNCFGKAGEGYVRLCFARPKEKILQGCNLMKEVLT